MAFNDRGWHQGDLKSAILAIAKDKGTLQTARGQGMENCKYHYWMWDAKTSREGPQKSTAL